MKLILQFRKKKNCYRCLIRRWMLKMIDRAPNAHSSVDFKRQWFLRGHSLSMSSKFSKKLIFLNPWYVHLKKLTNFYSLWYYQKTYGFQIISGGWKLHDSLNTKICWRSLIYHIVFGKNYLILSTLDIAFAF